MQVSYEGFFIFNFEMVDKILKPGSPEVFDCPVTLFTNKTFKKTAFKYKPWVLS